MEEKKERKIIDASTELESTEKLMELVQLTAQAQIKALHRKRGALDLGETNQLSILGRLILAIDSKFSDGAEEKG